MIEKFREMVTDNKFLSGGEEHKFMSSLKSLSNQLAEFDSILLGYKRRERKMEGKLINHSHKLLIMVWENKRAYLNNYDNSLSLAKKAAKEYILVLSYFA